MHTILHTKSSMKYRVYTAKYAVSYSIVNTCQEQPSISVKITCNLFYQRPSHELWITKLMSFLDISL